MIFYPHLDDAQQGSLEERIEVLMEAALRFKAIVLDESKDRSESVKRMVPRDQPVAYNWGEIAQVLRALRDLPESHKLDKLKKADLLTKLAEVYEVLRAAKMSKLEAVRLALIGEAGQLRSGASQVA
jgi:hypothetical protein